MDHVSEIHGPALLQLRETIEMAQQRYKHANLLWMIPTASLRSVTNSFSHLYGGLVLRAHPYFRGSTFLPHDITSRPRDGRMLRQPATYSALTLFLQLLTVLVCVFHMIRDYMIPRAI